MVGCKHAWQTFSHQSMVRPWLVVRDMATRHTAGRSPPLNSQPRRLGVRLATY
jgi:hypothetical protein